MNELEYKDAMDHSNRAKFLSGIDIGSYIAEDERERLGSFFLKTDIWSQVRNDQVDLILGDKGSGKSAIFLLLEEKRFDMLEKSDMIMLNAESVRGDTVFKDIATNPPKNEKEIEFIWRTYFLALVGRFISRIQTKGNKTKTFLQALDKIGIDVNLRNKLSEVLTSVRRFVEKIENGEVSITVDPVMNSPTFSYKLGKPNDKIISFDIALDKLYTLMDEILEQNGFKIWILIDRLDVAFEENADLEKNALRALLRAYRNCQSLKNMKLKIFLRSDIFNRITETGFRELSHLTRRVEIIWDKSAIINVIALRFASNKNLCTHFAISNAKVKINFDEQLRLINDLLPKKLLVTTSKMSSFDWIYRRLVDGKGRVCPRDFIFYFKQLLTLERRNMDIGKGSRALSIFSEEAVKRAFEATSQHKKESVLYAEYATERKFMDKLTGNKSEYKIEKLSKIWNINLTEVEVIVRKLMNVGFFNEKTDIHSGFISVPFLWRPAFRLKQGKAK